MSFTVCNYININSFQRSITPTHDVWSVCHCKLETPLKSYEVLEGLRSSLYIGFNQVAQKAYALESVSWACNTPDELWLTAAFKSCSNTRQIKIISTLTHPGFHSLNIFTKTLSCICSSNVKTSKCAQTDVLETSLMYHPNDWLNA